MSKAGKILGFIFIVVLIFSVFILVRRSQNKIDHITRDDIIDVIEKDSYVLIYYGEETDKMTKLLRSFKEDYLIQSYYLTSDVEELNKYIYEGTTTNKIFDLYIDGSHEALIDTTKEERVRELLRKYLYGEIPEDERYYKVLSSANEYIKKVNSKDLTVAVFGATSCTYCNLYLPVINEIAKEKNLDIYYFDADTYSESEYDKIMDLDLVIPGECTKDGKPTSFMSGFAKPMTIVTKNGELTGCVKGYYTKSYILSKLQEFKVIKES